MALFLEKSPASRVASESARAAESSGDLAKEPVGVEGVKTTFGRGGRLVLRASGRTIRRFLRGNLVRNSAVLMTGVMFWLLPPIKVRVPDFCSGMFQRMDSVKFSMVSLILLR